MQQGVLFEGETMGVIVAASGFVAFFRMSVVRLGGQVLFQTTALVSVDACPSMSGDRKIGCGGRELMCCG